MEPNATIDLDEVLALISPVRGKTPPRPTNTMREEMGILMGENSFFDTPLTLNLRSDEADFAVVGKAHRIQKDGDTYTLEEEIVLDRKVDWELWRDRTTLRGKMLSLALMIAKKNHSRYLNSFSLCRRGIGTKPLCFGKRGSFRRPFCRRG